MVEKNPTTSSASIPRVLTSEEFVAKLRAALKRDGDFPASAKLVGELRALVSDPKTNANQVTEIILQEPSLGTRVLHLVNSSFYLRAKPIMTVSQAVITIGMKSLAEMCASIVLLQKFVPAARRGGPFANCLQRTILTSLLSGSITSAGGHGNAKTKTDETSYLAGSFYEIGTLLLAYYFPQIYDNAVKRAESKKTDLAKSIQELTGLTPGQLSMEVIDALSLPEFYKHTLSALQNLSTPGSSKPVTGKDAAEIDRISRSLFAANKISEVITTGKNKQELDLALIQLKEVTGLDTKIFGEVVGELPSLFKQHCHSLELSLPPLPEYVASYLSPANQSSTSDSGPQATFSQFVEEIREAVENREPTASIITRVMETLAWGLGFDRVFLLLVMAGKKRLQGRMLLGAVDDFDPKSLQRPLGDDADSNAVDARAFKESRPIFNGDPIFEDGWPLACIPIGFGHRAIGVIYADRFNSKSPELEGREQAAIGVLAELLDRSIGLHSK